VYRPLLDEVQILVQNSNELEAIQNGFFEIAELE